MTCSIHGGTNGACGCNAFGGRGGLPPEAIQQRREAARAMIGQAVQSGIISPQEVAAVQSMPRSPEKFQARMALLQKAMAALQQGGQGFAQNYPQPGFGVGNGPGFGGINQMFQA